MRFRQLDAITDLQPGARITALRTLSGREGFLRDHFPQFPVLPGALMLEAMFQASGWLVRATDQFASSVVVLKEARNVKFAGLVRPGQTFTVSAAIKKHAPPLTTLVAEIRVDGAAVAGGRLVLESFSLSERYPTRAATDAYLRRKMQAELALLQSPQPHPPGAPTLHRWLWVDRFTEFVFGRRAVAIKTVSVTDEVLDLYMPGFPVMPNSLVMEGFAMSGGTLVSACHDFQKHVVLAKVGQAVFHRPAVPGDTIVYSTEIQSLLPDGALVHGSSCIAGQPHAEVELLFAYLDPRMIEAEPIGPADILVMLRLWGVYDVGRREDGSPLAVPQRLLDTEA